MQKNNASDKILTPSKNAHKDRQHRAPSRPSLKPFYTPADISEIPYQEEVGDPGQFPYKRGIHPDMYGSRLWTMRQYAGFATAEDSNRRFRYLLSQGQTGLSVAFDLPTQIGLDSDDPLAVGEVGKVGVAIDSIEDMESLFQGIPLDAVSTSMTINAPASILLCMYCAVARRRGISGDKLRGTVQNDILKEYIARGTYIFPARHSLRLVTDTFVFCARELPLWNPISVSGYHIREAGSTAAQEIAFTLANGVAYTEAALAAGLSLEGLASRISFFFSAHNNLFEEVAKFRAARKLWAELMRDRFRCRDVQSARLRFHAQTAGSSLTAQQPENNVVRVAYQALAAVLGGTQSLHTNSRDEALALPTQESATLALRTQQILAYESGVTAVADPLGGSYFVESLTKNLEMESRAYLDKIDQMGGMLRAIESGYVQKEIQDAAYDLQRRVENGDETIVGVNRFRDDRPAPVPLLRISEESERDQLERLRSLRERRDTDKVDRARKQLVSEARSGGNLLYPVLQAVESLMTVGEIVRALKSEFGEYQETIVI
ncbi:MAG TPA: methylmalonyl-CoA mutase family protein [Acidobacteriota bacterium]|jgi:methylmalonyl-CoA mutase N-terminal domain/subunit